ncbi:MAG: hypothetical protein KME10_24275 [Plectolyngbya sp. WJT66-NPBG17]|jgi:hypothetical protein|nr:hypothetical protein [Plectolyngbya sp. WJT66-NPBG17]
MSLRLIRAVSEAENTDELHLGRLLLLLKAKDNSGTKSKTIEGITKLAKFDFLLRYPNCLERALKAAGKNPAHANVKPYERTTIETKMIRFRYGPWDNRYRRWIGLLVARGLATTFVEGKTVHVGLTMRGLEIADQLAQMPEFQEIGQRSDLIVKSFNRYSATKIKEFIYEVFPELETMQWGEEISL